MGDEDTFKGPLLFCLSQWRLKKIFFHLLFCVLVTLKAFKNIQNVFKLVARLQRQHTKRYFSNAFKMQGPGRRAIESAKESIRDYAAFKEFLHTIWVDETHRHRQQSSIGFDKCHGQVQLIGATGVQRWECGSESHWLNISSLKLQSLLLAEHDDKAELSKSSLCCFITTNVCTSWPWATITYTILSVYYIMLERVLLFPSKTANAFRWVARVPSLWTRMQVEAQWQRWIRR